MPVPSTSASEVRRVDAVMDSEKRGWNEGLEKVLSSPRKGAQALQAATENEGRSPLSLDSLLLVWKRRLEVVHHLRERGSDACHSPLRTKRGFAVQKVDAASFLTSRRHQELRTCTVTPNHDGPFFISRWPVMASALVVEIIRMPTVNGIAVLLKHILLHWRLQIHHPRHASIVG